jgi:hypothetical protein
LESLSDLKSINNLYLKSPHLTREGMQALAQKLPALQYFPIPDPPKQQAAKPAEK